MKENRRFLGVDISFLAMLLLLFISVFFIGSDTEAMTGNFILLAVSAACAMLTYFTSLTAGLVVNLVLIFAYVTYTIFTSASSGVEVPVSTYFWMFWSPLMTTVTYFFTRRTFQAEEQNRVLQEQLDRLSGVDSLTELKNIRSFEADCAVYMKIAKRYHMSLVLVVWEFRFQRELGHMLGKEGLLDLVKRVSRQITAALREEDAIYLLEGDPYTWGSLLFTDPESVSIVVERVKNQLAEIQIQDAASRHSIELSMRVGIATFDDTITSPLALLEKAHKRSEYDV
ncbi:diguanylate cyclase [Oscillospiraceae bacterium MB08-C2-2]|nr:diguanylate cyclase [Oscillospiraceae bacterium MB08-C2-2]